MPGFYADGEYDLAGFIVGLVDRSNIVDGRGIAPGDVLIGLESAGLHTNGYSLARRILFEVLGWASDTFAPELGMTVGDALLAPHRSYLKAVTPLIEAGLVKGMAHITGGGITENVPRILPPGCEARVDRRAWPVPPMFRLLQHAGTVSDDEMFRTFNMGIGMIVVCAPESADQALRALTDAGGLGGWFIGSVGRGDHGVRY
jgi:phosphoribosylformylglycinamidine cyclo-ligase